MGPGGVDQLRPLAEAFHAALLLRRPTSVAILGIANGNGLDRIDPKVTSRVVGVDIHPGYIESVRRKFPGVELHQVDLSAEELRIPQVELVHAAFVFEHAGTDRCLDTALELVAPGGCLSVILQLPSESEAAVTPTGVSSIQRLRESFKVIEPSWLSARLIERGLVLSSEHTEPLKGGKSFWHALFEKVRFDAPSSSV